MKKLYTAWGFKGDEIPHTLVNGKSPLVFGDGTIDPECEVIFWQIEACTWEEACAVNNLRKGFEPYKPNGTPQSCPNCNAIFYPEGSGECWSCDYKC